MAIVREQYFNGNNLVALDTTNTDYEVFFGTARFSNTYKREGDTSAEFFAGTTATATYARYSFPETPVRYLSRYRRQALPSALTTMYRFRRVGTTQFLLRMSSTGLFSIADSSSTIVATMTKPIVANQAYRLEIDVVNQVVTMRIYLGANINGTVADDTISATLVFPSGSGSGAFDDYDEGFITARASYSVFVDTVRDDDTSNPGPFSISTTTETTALSHPNQRKIDRCQNGVLWASYEDGMGGGYAVRLRFSLDNGITWSDVQTVLNGSGSMGSTYTGNHSFFIDIDDYAHLVTKDPANGYIYYRRGTPNADRTSWTWSAAVNVGGTITTLDYPDIIAHREGSGWVAHVVYSYASGTANQATGARVNISSTGSITTAIQWWGSSNYANGTHTYPSIDFNHTGDGKTVKDGTPHLYVAWSAGATGSGKGMRFRKATYSASAWSWGTEREIDNTRYYYTGGSLNCLFDGTDVIIGYYGLGAATPGTLEFVLMQRDVADTTTTQLLRMNGNTSSFFRGSFTYDDARNIYYVGNPNTATKVVLTTWNRATGKLSQRDLLKFSGITSPFVSVRRSKYQNLVEYLFTDGTASPYDVRYGSVPLVSRASESFSYTGTAQQFVVPQKVTQVLVECWGAQGGSVVNNGGRGGYSQGTLSVTPGETLNVYVGGSGFADDATSSSPRNSPAEGGWNGGGNSGLSVYLYLTSGNNGYGAGGASGGGATDVRQGGTALSNRKIVAGAGGGSSSNTAGGDGGGITGSAGAFTVGTNGGTASAGGTQTAGGTAGNPGGTAGSLGVGGNGGNGSNVTGGGAGGGYYGGGGGGGSDRGTSGNGGGAGGSGYIGGVQNGSTSNGIGLGDGFALISWEEPAIPLPTSENISIRLTTSAGTTGNSQPGTPAGSLGGYTSTTDALSGSGSIFDDITNSDNQSSTTDYRAIDILNTHADLPLKNAKLFVINTPGGASVTAAIDNIGAVSKSASNQGASIPNETTAPTGVGTFVDATNGLLLGDIGPDQIIRVWLKRTVDNVPSINNDGLLIYIDAAGENKLNAYSATAEGTAQSPTWTWPSQSNTATFEVSTEQAHSGTKSWKITSADYAGVGITPLSAPSTMRMRFEGWMYQASGSPQNIIVGGMNDSGPYYEDYPVLVPSGVWTPFIQYIPSGYQGVVIYPSDSTITFYLDDMIYMEEPLIGPVVAGGDELLTDSQRLGEVDDGSIWNWRESTVSTAHSHSGSSSWSSVTSPTSGVSLDLDGAFDTEGVINWTWTGWMYQETGSNRTIEVTVEGTGQMVVTTLPSGVWTPFSISGTGQPLVLGLYEPYPSDWVNGDVLYFDDLSFKVVRELEMLTEYQRTASGTVTDPWETFSAGTPSVRSTTVYRNEPASWTITAPEWMKIDLSLPLITWTLKAWVYQTTGSNRDVAIGVDTVRSWADTTESVPSSSWTLMTLSYTTDVEDVYLSAQSTWNTGETLYFDDVSFAISAPYPGGITTTWNIEQIPWPRVSVWNGTAEVAASAKVWDGTSEVVSAPEVT